MPEEIAAIALQNKRALYGILFAASAATLRTIAADERHLGAEIGFVSVLHTWSQDLRTILTCTASCPVVGLRPMVAGCRAGRASSCRCVCSRRCSAASSWRNCGQRSRAALPRLR
jgi:hypothetical protein